MNIVAEIFQFVIIIATIIIVAKPTLLKINLSKTKIRIVTIIVCLAIISLICFLFDKDQNKIRERDVIFDQLIECLKVDSIQINEGVQISYGDDYDNIKTNVNNYLESHRLLLDSLKEIAETQSFITYTSKNRNEFDTSAVLKNKFRENQQLLDTRVKEIKNGILKNNVIPNINKDIRPLKLAYNKERLKGTEMGRWERDVVEDNIYLAIECTPQEISDIKNVLNNYTSILRYCGIDEIRLGVPRKEYKGTNTYVPTLYTEYFKTR